MDHLYKTAVLAFISITVCYGLYLASEVYQTKIAANLELQLAEIAERTMLVNNGCIPGTNKTNAGREKK